ncbi:MAG: hypothetical protein ACKO0N_18445 [Planctomycetota bacterium]
MKLQTGLVALLLVVGIGQLAEAQLTQIGRDYRQPMTYSPDDPFTKGLVYRLQTGQAGKYFNCDCEEEKRYSPYIYWQTVCNHTHPKPYCTVLLRDLHEVKERVRAGACRGGQNCTCGQCQQTTGGGYYLAENDGQATSGAASGEAAQPASAQAEATGDHIVYGSRATRQRLAQQGSFTAPASESAAAQTADSQKLPVRR